MKTGKWTAANNKGQDFIIKEDSKVGYYLFVYENGKCIKDHLQDTLEWAKRQALEDYGVPESVWKQVK